MSLGPIPSGRLKNLKDVDKWSSLSLYLPVRGMSVTCELGLYLCSQMGLIASAFSPVVYGDIALSTNTQYNTISTSHICDVKARICENMLYKIINLPEITI